MDKPCQPQNSASLMRCLPLECSSSLPHQLRSSSEHTHESLTSPRHISCQLSPCALFLSLLFTTRYPHNPRPQNCLALMFGLSSYPFLTNQSPLSRSSLHLAFDIPSHPPTDQAATLALLKLSVLFDLYCISNFQSTTWLLLIATCGLYARPVRS